MNFKSVPKNFMLPFSQPSGLIRWKVFGNWRMYCVKFWYAKHFICTNKEFLWYWTTKTEFKIWKLKAQILLITFYFKYFHSFKSLGLFTGFIICRCYQFNKQILFLWWIKELFQRRILSFNKNCEKQSYRLAI